MAGVHFDADTHTYANDSGKAFPSVTTIIGEAWPINTAFFNNKNGAIDNATTIHELTAMVDSGIVALDDLRGEPMFPAVHSWATFLERIGAEVAHVEIPFIDEYLQFAGTIDRILRIDGQLVICDIKTGTTGAYTPMQLGAYSIGAKQLTGEFVTKGIVALVPRPPKEGATKPVNHDLNIHREAFIALRRWQMYRESRGKKK